MKRTFPTRLWPLVATALAAGPVAGQALDDAAIAHIAVTANQLDITAAEQALERSANPEVRAFAETMIRDHAGVIQQAAALARRLGVTLKENDTSRALEAQAADARDHLRTLRGVRFDLAYMENEVAYHETVIAAVEQTLVPHTSNAELRQLLQSVVPALRAHLEHARRLHGELASR